MFTRLPPPLQRAVMHLRIFIANSCHSRSATARTFAHSRAYFLFPYPALVGLDFFSVSPVDTIGGFPGPYSRSIFIRGTARVARTWVTFIRIVPAWPTNFEASAGGLRDTDIKSRPDRKNDGDLFGENCRLSIEIYFKRG